MNLNEIRLGKFLALISYAAFVLNGVFIREELMVLAAGISGLGALALITPLWKQFPSYLTAVLAILFASVFLIAIKVNFYPVAFTFVVTTCAAVAIAIYIHAFPELFRVRLVLYSLLAYFFAATAIGIRAEDVFAGSRNQISVILLSFSALALALESRKTDLILALAVFLACVLAVGSSGILASAVLVLASLFRQNQPIALRVAIFLGLISVFVAFQIYLEFYAPRELVVKFSYSRLTADDVRFQIIDDYMARYLTGSFLWLGAPDDYAFYVYSRSSSGGLWAYVNTLHNSYLSVHAKVGILAVLVYVLIAKVTFGLRRDPYIFLLFSCLLIRAFGDSVLIFDGYYNFSFYFFFIVASLKAAAKRAEVSGREKIHLRQAGSVGRLVMQQGAASPSEPTVYA